MFWATQHLNFTTRYRSGDPFKTGAVNAALEVTPAMASKEIFGFTVKQTAKKTVFTRKLEHEDFVYGLGESLGGLNKRGMRYRLFAKDDPSHTPEKASLYGSHPFLFISGKESFGLFLDYPSEIIFDVGWTEINTLSIEIQSKDFDLYVFKTDKLLEATKELLRLTGTPYLPPRWAFGYQQCRYSYPDEATVRGIHQKLSENDIPCDAIYIDIDYMEGYKIFTVNKEAFPDLKKLALDLKEQGVKLIPIIDPGVKVEEGYQAYETGKAAGAFCKDKEGKDFIGAVWPGYVHFPDFLNPVCREWWGGLYKDFVDSGIEHVWNDMNEPAVFFTEKGLKKLRSHVRKYTSKLDPGPKGVEFIGGLGHFWGNETYFRDFFHLTENGKQVCHKDVHNLYGFYMTLASAEGLKKLVPNQRYFLLTRSSYQGLQRFAIVWTGDNTSWWEHILVQMKMLMSFNMNGFFFTGGDIGGFMGDSNPELLVRWLQFGVFSPLYRNHSTKGSRDQDPWAFDEATLRYSRDIIKLRYALIPWMYSTFIKCTEELTPPVTPLFVHFDSHETRNIEDEFMFGGSLLVAPIHQPNARGRFVHLPGCRWLLWKAARWDEREMKVYEPGNYFVDVAINEMPVFVKENALFALCAPGKNSEVVSDELLVSGFVSGAASLVFLHDDGNTFNYKNGELSKIEINVQRTAEGMRCEALVFNKEDSAARLPYRRLRFEVYDETGARHEDVIEIG